MPSTESVRKFSTQGVSAMTPADTATTSGPDPVDIALPPGAPDTAATRALWAALAAHVTATAVELASTAGVSRSAANQTLAALEEAGLATRTAGAREGTQRLPDQWQAVMQLEPTVPESTKVADTTIGVGNHIEAPVSEQHEGAQSDEATEQHEAVAADPPKGDSAAPPVLASIKARLGDLTPSAIGRALAHSSGAIANACEKLAREGAIAQTSGRPRKYHFADRA